MEFRTLHNDDVPLIWKINEEGLPGTGEISHDGITDLLKLGELCIGAFEENKLSISLSIIVSEIGKFFSIKFR